MHATSLSVMHVVFSIESCISPSPPHPHVAGELFLVLWWPVVFLGTAGETSIGSGEALPLTPSRVESTLSWRTPTIAPPSTTRQRATRSLRRRGCQRELSPSTTSRWRHGGEEAGKELILFFSFMYEQLRSRGYLLR